MKRKVDQGEKQTMLTWVMPWVNFGLCKIDFLYIKVTKPEQFYSSDRKQTNTDGEITC